MRRVNPLISRTGSCGGIASNYTWIWQEQRSPIIAVVAELGEGIEILDIEAVLT